MSELLSRADILTAFAALSDRLAAAGTRASLFVVGGAAMTVAFKTRNTTHDIDAAFQPAAAVREAAADVGDDLGFSGDWLNDAVKGFLHGPDLNASLIYEGPYIVDQVRAASSPAAAPCAMPRDDGMAVAEGSRTLTR